MGRGAGAGRGPGESDPGPLGRRGNGKRRGMGRRKLDDHIGRRHRPTQRMGDTNRALIGIGPLVTGALLVFRTGLVSVVFLAMNLADDERLLFAVPQASRNSLADRNQDLEHQGKNAHPGGNTPLIVPAVAMGWAGKQQYRLPFPS